MSDEIPEFDPLPEDDEGPEVSSKQLSKFSLFVGIAVMLLPAGIPLYFALRVGGTAAIWLIALAGAVALVNTVLVFVLWNWINSLRAQS